MSILSVYLSNHHDYPTTWDYLKRLQPAWVRIHQPDARTIHLVQHACPTAKLMLRSWDIDDHNGDRKRELYANPKQAAAQTIQRWGATVGALAAESARNGWDINPDRWYLGLWNEPDNEHIPQVVEGTAEAMRLAAQWGWHLGVGIPGVGRFPKPDEPGPNWNLFRPLEQPIRDGGHILICHEYWQPEGPDFVWTDNEGQQRHDAGNLAWRHRHIPLNVPILIGESGANGYIYNRHADKDDGGWQRYRHDPQLQLTPQRYAAQVQEYIRGCDTRVQGVCLYMTDYHSDQWRSFDTEPAHADLLAIRHTVPAQLPPGIQPADKDHSVHVPIVGGPQPPHVEPKPKSEQSMSAINPLALEAIIAVESGHRAFGEGGRLLIRFEAHIFKTHLGDDALFNRHFRHGSPPWTEQQFNPDGQGPWFEIHTGSQQTEYNAFELAKRLNSRAAYMAISMGAPQIMGFNHARIGFDSAQAMYARFSQSWYAQVIALINFVLGDPALVRAINDRNWRDLARIYNGPGNVDYAAPRYEAAYLKLTGRV